MSTIEKRFISTCSTTADGRIVSGYGSVFDSPANIGNMFTEIVRAGAFKRSIQEGRDTQFRVNHSPDFVLARVGNKTLSLSEDSTGLRFRANVARTTVGNDLLALIKRQDLRGCSFAFFPQKERWSRGKDANGNACDVRELLDVDLYDCSVVAEPAYDATSVQMDSKDNEWDWLDDLDGDDGLGDGGEPNQPRSRSLRMPLHAMLPAVPSGCPIELRQRLDSAIALSGTPPTSPQERILRTQALIWLSKE
jgi:HK97 family phage prohead protease